MTQCVSVTCLILCFSFLFFSFGIVSSSSPLLTLLSGFKRRFILPLGFLLVRMWVLFVSGNELHTLFFVFFSCECYFKTSVFPFVCFPSMLCSVWMVKCIRMKKDTHIEQRICN